MLLFLTKEEREARIEQPARFAEDGFDERRGGRRFLLEGFRLTDDAPDALWAHFGDAPALIGAARGAYVFGMLGADGSATVGHDLLAKRSLYYCAQDGLLACGTSFFALAKALRERGVALSADEGAVAAMCRDGVFTGDQTYVREIKFLPPYRYLTYRDGVTEVCALPLPGKRADTVDEAVARMDALFAQGCALQYRKNARRGYPQVMTLSAGMDSRMTLKYLLEVMRAEGVPAGALTTLTYAQSGSMDETVAARISEEMGCGHAFRALDGGGFLLKRDAILAQNEGQMGYGGSTGAYDMFADREGLGAVHTGLGGGEIMGDILSGEATDEENDARNLGDMRVCLNFQKTTHRFCEACSPFLYEPFYEYVLSLPTEMKLGRALYTAWYRAKVGWGYPTTYYRGPVGSRADKLAGGALMRLMTMLGKKSRFDMNPFAAWYRENPALGAYLADTLAADALALHGRVKDSVLEAVSAAFTSGSPEQKAQALTATGALRQVVGDRDRDKDRDKDQDKD